MPAKRNSNQKEDKVIYLLKVDTFTVIMAKDFQEIKEVNH